MQESTNGSSDLVAQSVPTRRAKHPLLTKPIYAFDVPQPLLGSLQLRSDVELPEISQVVYHDVARPDSEDTQPVPFETELSKSQHGVPPCSLCPQCRAFPSVSAQRAHFRSDWHRYNVQLNMRDNPVLLNEQDFEKLSEEVETASESEIDEDEKSRPKMKVDIVTKLLSRATIDKGTPSSLGSGVGDLDHGSEGGQLDTIQTPLLWFICRPSAPPDQVVEQTQFGFYRNIFPDPGSALSPDIQAPVTPNAWYTACLESMQVGRIHRPGSKQGTWKGKRIKSREVQDAAKLMMMTVLDGEGFIPGLKLTHVPDSDIDESDEYSDYSDADLHSSEDDSTVSSIIRNPSTDPPLRMWTIVLLGGGHFAASVIALNPHITTFQGKKHRAQGPREDRSLILLAHKAFHRYTTRRKQGGGQSAQDATGKFAKSAGAQLRRYNESALGDDVRGLLDAPGWRELISRSDKIWFRAGARAAKGMLWSWEGAKASRGSPLDAARSDGRLDSLPFPTRRPTIGETVRCFVELSRVKIEHKTDEELAAEEQAHRVMLSHKLRREADAKRREEKAQERAAAVERSKAERAQAAQPQLSAEEQAQRNRWQRLLEMMRKGRLEALIAFLGKYQAEMLQGDINTPFPDWLLELEAQEEASSATGAKLKPRTLLQLAAEGGNENVVRYLLEERRADPTIETARLGAIRKQASTDVPDSAGSEDLSLSPHRTAYDLCSTKEARNVFRRSMALHPDWCNWGGMTTGGARVPSALTDEMQESQVAKQKDRRATLREKARERTEKLAEKTSTETSAAPSSPADKKPTASSHHTTNRLGGAGAAPRALLQQRDEDAGLTAEMRARIERERRARAAEERIKAMMNKPG